MARTRLIDAEIRRIKPRDEPYKVKDSNGLYLLVSITGSRLWRYRFRINGKESTYAIGKYPDISLADARTARDIASKLVKQGINPAIQRKNLIGQIKVPTDCTFEAVARDWMKSKRKWRNNYRKQVESTLGKEVFPLIGLKAMDKVTATDLRNIIKPIVARDATTVARLIRQWCLAIGHYAISDGKAEINVAASLKGLFEVKERDHCKPLSEQEIPGLINKLEEDRGTESVRIALKLLMYTFVRTGELRCSDWSEFDIQNAVWHIPAIRMKKGREHVVPLSNQVILLLGQLRQINNHPNLLFPNTRDNSRFMSPTTLNRHLERLGYLGKFSAHGFRATASTILNAKGFNPDVIELQLAHLDKNLTRRSYNQGNYMEQRVELMQKWADYIDGLGK